MGADCFVIYLALPLDASGNPRKPNWKAGYAALKKLKLKDVDLELLEESPSIKTVRDIGKKALNEIQDALVNRGREVCQALREHEALYLTGGMTYGDPPTELYAAFETLLALPTVMTAVGFKN